MTSFFITSSGNTVKRWKSAKERAANTVVDVNVRVSYCFETLPRHHVNRVVDRIREQYSDLIVPKLGLTTSKSLLLLYKFF